MAKRALLIIDMLNDFIQDDAPLCVPGGKEIIPNIQQEIERAHQEEAPVIFVCDNHTEADPEMKVFPLHAITGTQGAEIVPELNPGTNENVVKKTRYDGFYQTNLEKLLITLGIRELTLTGVATEICINYTGAAAIMRGYKVDVPDDCVKALKEEDGRFALHMLRDVLQ